MVAASAPAAVGPYRIVRLVGAGGWSTVYEVTGPDGAALALKRLTAALAPAALARFRREVESLRRIDHPGVLRLVDAGVDDAGAPYLVTPLVVGTSLRELIERAAPAGVGVEAAVAIVLGAAEAVAAIHAAALVHRDLKPEHLLVTPAGDVVVIDLGLALGPEHSRHTAEDTVTGSVPYMAPEQIDDRAPSAASDVWALGVVLHESIAGRRPFARARQSEEVAAILAGRAPALDEVAPRCPAELARLVASCLAAAPAQRPPDAAALTRALTAQVDWTAPARLRDERARLLADPVGLAAEHRDRRVALAMAAAERALAAGDRFAATREVERGLAYAPDAPVLRALVERLLTSPTAGAVRPAQTVRGHAPPPPPPGPARQPASGASAASAPGAVGAAPPAVGGASALAALVVAPVITAPGLPSARARRRWAWAAATLGLLVLAGAGAALVSARGDGPPASPPPPEAAGAAAVAAGDAGPAGDPWAGGAAAAAADGSRPERVELTRPARVAPSRPRSGHVTPP